MKNSYSPRSLAFAFLTIGSALSVAHGGEAVSPAGQLIPQAVERLKRQPDARHALGLAEMHRAAGQRQQASDVLTKAAATAAGTNKAALCEALCWRMLPIEQPALPAFRRQCDSLAAADPENAWSGVFRLLAAAADQDRVALLQAAAVMKPPKQFPSVGSERAHLALLQELGMARNPAGLEVLRARAYQPLYALRDLDRSLTRDADFLEKSGRTADAASLRRCRDSLRAAWLDCSQQLVERLFALNLLEKSEQRTTLAERAQAVPFLQDQKELDRRLAAVSEEDGWKSLVEPLLTSEVAAIEAAPRSAAKPPAEAELVIRARLKRPQNGSTVYEGPVEMTLGRLSLSCERLELSAVGPHVGAVLKGAGKVVLRGVPGFDAHIAADRFSFDSGAGVFKLEGNVQLGGAGRTLKCETCTLAAAGEILRSHTLLDEFAETVGVEKRLALLTKIARAYADEELPPEVRYLLAMKLLRPHLTWHLPYLPPEEIVGRGQVKTIREVAHAEQLQRNDDDWRWSAAHGGEEWMVDDIPHDKLRQAREEQRQRLHAEREKRTGKKELEQAAQKPAKADYFWRLKEPKHADVLRAVKLLEPIHQGELSQRARRWLADIARNNTVVTLDVPGAFAAGKKGPLVVDVRNADRLQMKLYRVRRPQDLLAVETRIGEDFIYRDYGLDADGRALRAKQLHAMRAMHDRLARAGREQALPQLDANNLIHQWTADVGKLAALDLDREDWYGRDDDWDDEDDREAEFFGDRCEQFRERLQKSYWPGWEKASSWQCDRLLEIPAAAVKEPGAYILAVEANGQTVYAPVLVDPLSLVMRRCRDGVFVLLSDSEGKQPVAGARIHAEGMLGDAATNVDGVAFARVFAAGDRAIAAEKDGRYAVGGFGTVFDGIYMADSDRERRWRNMKVARELRKAVEQAAVAQVYADRYIVAAYTDRPTYRPGQEVQLKLIVRRLPPGAQQAKARLSADFRAGDFDWSENLEIPERDSAIRFQAVNPAGRAIGSGEAKLNDFGTAAGTIRLPEECKLGNYTLRVNVGGTDRIVPAAFAVKYYRRPNFELEVAGMPETLKPAQAVNLKLAGRYYFGKPVAGAKLDVRLVHLHAGKPLLQTELALDAAGQAAVAWELPPKLAAGEYRLIAAATDQSGRAVTKIVACRVEGPHAAAAAAGLAALPRFVPVDEVFEVKTPAAEVAASQCSEKPERRLVFKADGGTAKIKLPAPGWYVLTAGEATTEIFAFGGDDDPLSLMQLPQELKDANDQSPEPPRWVNLTDYEAEEDRAWHFSDDDRGSHLLALFDRQHVNVGETLRVLVYVPGGRCRVLFTIEGRTVVDYVLPQERFAGSYGVFEIPVKRRYLPNFYLQGRVLTAGDAPQRLREVRMEKLQELAAQSEDDNDGSEDPRWCRVDVFDPEQRPGGQRLNVAIATDKPAYRPGEKVGVRIETRDLKGRPCEAEVSLAAVDESVFSFGEDRVDSLPLLFADPHPEQRFMRKTWRASAGKRELQVLREMAAAAMAQQKAMDMAMKMAEQIQQLAGVRPPEDLTTPVNLLAGELPATSIPLARLRADFRETAAWLPQLRTDREGRLETSFTLPDSLTRYRLTGVGLTRQTDIGVGRARITATMPLSVQVFLPRFAVERDRIEAVGLIHNNTEKDRTCDVAWEVVGARAETPAGDANQWRVTTEDGKTLVQGRVTVPAGKSARVPLPLVFERIDTVRVTLRAGDGADSDAEVRTLAVQPLGRPRDVAHNGSFKGRHEWKLPPGFVPLDLQLSIARADAAGALEGIGYLIDYPYGCVEQTMSRFLPAVMVKRAAGQSPIALPPEVAAKLPDVLKKGLERLYNFQHPDGSWGWFEKDARNDPMTIYVLYGLARCRNAGTQVDADAFARACAYLRGRLSSGGMAAADRPSAWLTLALAGQADAAALKADAQKALDAADKMPVQSAAYLALACRTAGLSEPGERLFGRVREWDATATDELAMKLTLQIAFGAPLDQCRLTTAKLLARRNGQYWENTRATSWAIEALSQMLRYDPVAPKPRRIVVSVGGKTVLELARPEQLEAAVCRIHLKRGDLPIGDGLPITMTVDADQAVNFALSASGIQRLDKLEPEGTKIKLTRTLTAADGKPSTGRSPTLPSPGRSETPSYVGEKCRLRQGDVVAVRLSLELTEPQQYLIVEDRRPAGCEFADEQLDGPAAASAVNVEFRDDRVSAFFTSLPAGKHELIYYLRAEHRGMSNVLPGVAYPMYSDRVRGETGALRLEVE